MTSEESSSLKRLDDFFSGRSRAYSICRGPYHAIQHSQCWRLPVEVGPGIISAGHFPFMRMRALVIEDDDTIAKLNQRLLEQEGFVVDLAATVRDGSRLVERESYDLITLDMHLPDG